MWGEDDKPSKGKRQATKRNLLENDGVDRPITPVILAPEDMSFRYYAEVSDRFRRALGIVIEKGKVEIVDEEALKKLEPHERDILRDVCQKLVKEYKAGQKFWKKPPGE